MNVFPLSSLAVFSGAKTAQALVGVCGGYRSWKGASAAVVTLVAHPPARIKAFPLVSSPDNAGIGCTVSEVPVCVLKAPMPLALRNASS